MSESLSVDYFHQVYENDTDPWNFATSPYEDSKYSDTLASLPGARYRNALEIGCSIGVLTARLAQRCEQLLAIDVSRKALDAARKRCQHFSNVDFREMSLPAEYPDGEFDLTVLSEVAYYWSREDLRRAAQQIVEHLTPAGQLILVHWTPIVPDYPLTGDNVHSYFLQLKQLSHLHGHVMDKYRLDVFQRA